MEATGLTVKLPPVMVYVLAPEGLITTEEPAQVILLLFREITGLAFTDTVATAELVQAPLVPRTV